MAEHEDRGGQQDLHRHEVLGRIVLITGPEEFLAERAVTAAREAVKAADPQAEFSETTGDQLTMATLGEMSAPSLFSTTRCVVVRNLENVPDDTHPGLLAYAEDPAPDIGVVLVHNGGPKGSGLLNRLRALPAVSEVKSGSVSARELGSFVTSEMRSHKVRIDPEAADLLVAAVGNNLRALAAAASQLAADVDGSVVTADLVKTYFGGRAEAKSFTIADLTLAGQPAKALEELRWGLATGLAPVLVTSALAAGVRSLIGFKEIRASEAQVASILKVPPFKVRIIRDQARGWESVGLAQAVRLVAHADADVKGQASDAAYALEKLVIAVAGLRTRR